MSNQTKIGLLLGLGVVLLVGIIVSDHLSQAKQSDITESGPTLAKLSSLNGDNQRQDAFQLPAPPSHDDIASGNPAFSRSVVPVVQIFNNTPPNNTANNTFALPTGPAAAPIKTEIAQPVVKTVIPVTPPAPAPRTYTVKAGDTLSIIAAATLGSRNRWQEILDANKQTLASSKNLSIGMVLNIPAATAAVATPPAAAPTAPAPIVARTYTVQKGDLLGSIASKQLGSSKRVKDLVDANKKTLTNGEKSMLHIGMVLNIPAQ